VADATVLTGGGRAVARAEWRLVAEQWLGWSSGSVAERWPMAEQLGGSGAAAEHGGGAAAAASGAAGSVNWTGDRNVGRGELLYIGIDPNFR
jgi:hypothetical protein